MQVISRWVKGSKIYQWFTKPEPSLDALSPSAFVQTLRSIATPIQPILALLKKISDIGITASLAYPYKTILASLIGIIFTKVLFHGEFLQSFLLALFLSIMFVSCALNVIERASFANKRIISYLIIASLALRLVLVFTVFHSALVFPDELSTYHAAGEKLANVFHGSDVIQSEEWGWLVTPFTVWLGVLYYFLGSLILIGKMFNVFFFLSASLFLYLAAKEVFDEKAALVTLILSLLMPQFMLWSIPLLRESMALLLLCILLWSFTRLTKTLTLFHILLSVLLILLIFKIRYYLAIVLFCILLLVILTSLFTLRKRKMRTLFILILVAMAFVVAFQNVQKIYQSPNAHIIAPSIVSFQALQGTRNWISQNGGTNTNFYADVTLDTPKKVLQFLPIAYTYFFFAPFPFSIQSARLFGYFIINLLEYALFPFFLYGLYLSRNRIRHAYPVIIYILLVATLYGLAEPNLGGLLRHKIQVTAFMLIFAAKGLVNTGLVKVLKL